MMSIRARFFIISVASVTIALLFAAWFLVELFSDNYGRRIDAELTEHINQLTGALEFSADGRLQSPDGPADNRFRRAYGGLYWQINDPAKNAELRSPSLFDFALPLPRDSHPPGTIHRYRLKGPEGTDVVVQERVVLVAAPGGSRYIRIAVALDAAVLEDARGRFAWEIMPYVGLLAIFLVLMSTVQLRIGLEPLGKVGRDLENIRQRKAERLPGPYPKELTGLASQVNHLLEAQSSAIEKARRRASDLAHGLKTPLTVIANDALTLRDRGETKIADELDALAESMLAHVNHELARARIAQSAELRRSDSRPAKIASDIIRTLKRTGHGEALEWITEIPDPLTLPIDPHDLRELIGNLLENAAKWARNEVSIRLEGSRLVIEDDGPGVAEERMADLTQRGLRLDDRTPGSGLGLAIVKEITEVYGLGLTLENRSPAGFRATVIFSAAPTPT